METDDERRQVSGYIFKLIDKKDRKESIEKTIERYQKDSVRQEMLSLLLEKVRPIDLNDSAKDSELDK